MRTWWLSRRLRGFLGVLFLWLAMPTVAAAQNETIEYYGLDAIGSIRVVFSAAGAVEFRVDYSPFGEQIAGSKIVPKAYAQLFRDGEAGADYAQARMYQVRTGRLSAPDPVLTNLSNPQRLNRYAYALNQPLAMVDPTGLTATCPPGSNADFCTTNGDGDGDGNGDDPGDGTNPGRPPSDPGNPGCLPFPTIGGCDGEPPPGGIPTPTPTPTPTPPTPPPGPPAPPPPPPSPPTPTWRDRMRCAASTASSISMSYWMGFEGTAFGDVVLGNDFSDISNLITDFNGTNASKLITSNPSDYNLVDGATALLMRTPVSPEKIHVRQNGAGTWYSSGITGGPLMNTAAGRVISKGLVRFSGVKIVYDLGTYAGAFRHCGG